MSDYIKREDALKSIDTHNESVKEDIRTLAEEYYEYKDGVDYAYETIKHDVPAANVVEVMRCKDCKFWGDEDGIQYNEHIEKRCARCRAHNYEFDGQHWGWCPTEDDYCSFGERKEVRE